MSSRHVANSFTHFSSLFVETEETGLLRNVVLLLEHLVRVFTHSFTTFVILPPIFRKSNYLCFVSVTIDSVTTVIDQMVLRYWNCFLTRDRIKFDMYLHTQVNPNTIPVNIRLFVHL